MRKSRRSAPRVVTNGDDAAAYAKIWDLRPFGLDCIPEVSRIDCRMCMPSANQDGAHTHPGDLEFIYCRRGAGLRIQLGERDYPFSPGDMFFARPNERHYLKSYPKSLITYVFRLTLPKRGGKLLA